MIHFSKLTEIADYAGVFFSLFKLRALQDKPTPPIITF
jgi:hypothetical protein